METMSKWSNVNVDVERPYVDWEEVDAGPGERTSFELERRCSS